MKIYKTIQTLTVIVSLLLIVACSSHGGPKAGQRYAVLQTGDSRLAQHIFPVEIYNIDGEEQNTGRVNNNNLNRIRVDRPIRHIEPGVHTIKARAFVDRRYVPGLTRDISNGKIEPLTHRFVSGKRYFIGLKADTSRSADWQLVIWKEEEIEQGLIDVQ